MNFDNFCEEIKVKVHQYSIEYGYRQFDFFILYNEVNINCHEEETNIEIASIVQVDGVLLKRGTENGTDWKTE